LLTWLQLWQQNSTKSKACQEGRTAYDIGKVPDDEPELPHAVLGMKMAEKYKKNRRSATPSVPITMKLK